MNLEKAEFFDGQADAAWATEEYGEDERLKIRRLGELSEIEPGMQVLEPGCGTGRMTAILAGWVGEQGKVVAMDISPGMIAACGPRLEQFGERVQLMTLAMEELSLPPGVFHRVICHQVFPHFDDQEKALGIMHRLLKDDGLIVVAHFTSREAINDTHRKAGTVVESDMLPEEAEMAAMMDRAGFEVDFSADDDLGYVVRARKR